LEDNPNIRKIVLCLDNDEAGQQAMARIAVKLVERGYDDVSVLLPQNKDFNEDLKASKNLYPAYNLYYKDNSLNIGEVD
jgi:DNA primase